MIKWSEDNIIKELKIIIDNINHFPTCDELISMDRYDLIGAIYRYGNINKFRTLLGYELLSKPNNYWTENTTINELKSICNKIGHFPTIKELIDIGIIYGIYKHGGINKFRNLLGYDISYKPDGYWTDDNIIKELKSIISKINHFPLYNEIREIGLGHIVNKHGGLNKFRILLGYEIHQNSPNYWSFETTQKELKLIIEKLGHFPGIDELIRLNRSDLIHSIHRNGNINKFKESLGYHPSMYEKYVSDRQSYSVRRGKNTENLVKKILIQYCKFHNFPEPSYNQKLSKGHILEFICNTNKKIGIDVTNTKTNRRNIIHKWLKKDYYKYLDELWIVVFSDTFTPNDYIKWNSESPINVKIFSIYDFLKELDYSLSEDMKNKIDKYNSCTFHTKEELKHSSYEDDVSLPFKETR